MESLLTRAEVRLGASGGAHRAWEELRVMVGDKTGSYARSTSVPSPLCPEDVPWKEIVEFSRDF